MNGQRLLWDSAGLTTVCLTMHSRFIIAQVLFSAAPKGKANAARQVSKRLVGPTHWQRPERGASWRNAVERMRDRVPLATGVNDALVDKVSGKFWGEAPLAL